MGLGRACGIGAVDDLLICVENDGGVIVEVDNEVLGVGIVQFDAVLSAEDLGDAVMDDSLSLE